VQLLASIGSYVVLVLLVHTVARGQEALAVAVAGVAILLMPLDTLAMVFQVQMKLVRAACASAVGALMKLGAVAGAVALGLGVTGIITATTGATIAGYGLSFLVLRGCVDWARVRPQPQRYRPLLAEAWPLAVATVFGTLISQIPFILLGRLSTVEQVGYFSAANKLASQLVVIPSALVTSVYPIFSRLAAEDRASLGRVLSRILRYMTILGFPLIVLGVVMGPWVIRLLYGSQFRPSAPVMALLFAQSALLYPGILAGEAMIALGKQRTNLAIQVTGAILVTLGCAVLAGPYGAVGAAVAVLAGFGVIFVCTIVVAYRHLSACLQVRWLALTVAGLGLVGGLLIASHFLPLMGALIVALVVYGIVLFVLRVLNKGDVHLLLLMVTALRRRGEV
jgi:O-antigen/teichoic acid export membrane protein